jgi:hypothetical protein
VHIRRVFLLLLSVHCVSSFISVWFSRRQNAPRVPEQVLIMAFCSYGGGRGSSVSIVSGYGLDDRAIADRSPAAAKDFSCIQTGSEAHTVSCTMGTGGPFSGAKRGWGVTLTNHPHLVPRSRMSRSYISSPPQAPPWRVAGLFCFAHMGNGCSGVHTAYSRGQAATHFRKQTCLIVVQYVSP